MAQKAKKQRKQTPTSVVVGSNVYRLRVLKAPAWSREKLAALAGVSAETIRLLERNRIPDAEQLSPHLDTLDRLASALGVDFADLYREDSPLPSKPTGQPRHLSLVPHTGDALPSPS